MRLIAPRRIINVLAAVLLCSWAFDRAHAQTCTPLSADATFEDDFAGREIDRCRWTVVQENWGGKIGEEDYNGGVSPQNVSVSEGVVHLRALGNLYEGPVRGTTSDGGLKENGRRTGAAIRTRQHYLGGRFEARVAIAREPGVCSAMWTFFYESLPPSPVRNHEIDIEFPGREHIDAQPSMDHVAFTTWTGLEKGQSSTSFRSMPSPESEFHTLRFDWRPPKPELAGRVDFYVDGLLLYTASENIPSEPAPLWLGVWFPQEWAGDPEFKATDMRIDWVRISPLDH